MAQWSKLQKEIYNLIDERLNLQIHCTLYRMDTQRGNSTDLPRYWITLDKGIIFDYPKQFIDKTENELHPYPYYNQISDISDLFREYIDTPIEELLDKTFSNDKWQLTEILKASDRRIGQRRLNALKSVIQNEWAKKIIDLRQSF